MTATETEILEVLMDIREELRQRREVSAVPSQVYGPLTDSELRATPVPVSGLFYPPSQPVSGPLTNDELRGAPLEVAGKVATGGLTDDQLRRAPLQVEGPLTLAELLKHHIQVLGRFFPDIQQVAGPLTNEELRAKAIPVTGAFYPQTQPVTGNWLTDNELRAAPVQVTGEFYPFIQKVSGPITDQELRAKPVEVAGPVTDVQLRARPVRVDGEFYPNVQKITSEQLPLALREGRLDTAHTYRHGEVLADIEGQGRTRVINFQQPMDVIYVLASGGEVRVDVFGGEPTESRGVPCYDGSSRPFTITTDVLKVFIPHAVKITVWGFRY